MRIPPAIYHSANLGGKGRVPFPANPERILPRLVVKVRHPVASAQCEPGQVADPPRGAVEDMISPAVESTNVANEAPPRTAKQSPTPR